MVQHCVVVRTLHYCWNCGSLTDLLKSLFPNLFKLEENKDCRVNVCLNDLNIDYQNNRKRPLLAEVEINELVNLCMMLLQV
ncbi:hypothetical protein HanRHA438_Chr06g0273401 [Helianthus annuus]|nr:hypothetical protein HanIR_Chr06g0284061 [Helianthus annuus]KAJ0912360.1 hypothetical protein HanRHA438_Chr06g0273401 [Helianthus annuus]